MKERIKKGMTFRASIGGRHPYKIHIIAIVEKDIAVFKYYGRVSQYWHYEAKEREYLQWDIDRAIRMDKKNGKCK